MHIFAQYIKKASKIKGLQAFDLYVFSVTDFMKVGAT